MKKANMNVIKKFESEINSYHSTDLKEANKTESLFDAIAKIDNRLSIAYRLVASDLKLLIGKGCIDDKHNKEATANKDNSDYKMLTKMQTELPKAMKNILALNSGNVALYPNTEDVDNLVDIALAIMIEYGCTAYEDLVQTITTKTASRSKITIGNERKMRETEVTIKQYIYRCLNRAIKSRSADNMTLGNNYNSVLDAESITVATEDNRIQSINSDGCLLDYETEQWFNEILPQYNISDKDIDILKMFAVGMSINQMSKALNTKNTARIKSRLANAIRTLLSSGAIGDNGCYEMLITRLQANNFRLDK